MSIVSMIKAKMQRAKKKRNAELKRKFYEIRDEVIKFYEHKDITEGVTISIPAFIRADQILAKVVKTPTDINFYYGKLLKYRRITA